MNLPTLLFEPRVSVLQVLYEDNHCLAVNKPAGWLTMGDATGDRTLLDVARDYIREKYHKPGEVFLGVVHRLDRPVSGVVLFARTSKGASRLSEQFREREVEKTYWAVCTGQPPASGELRDRLAKDHGKNVSRVSEDDGEDGLDSRLSYRRLQRRNPISLLEIRPLTGRSHQIRLQLAHAGWPIVGDRKYGSLQPFVSGAIALHARALTFRHPTRQEPISVVADPPGSWSRFDFSSTT